MKAESSENFFSRREELLAGKAFGNLDPNELVELSENEPYSEAEQKLLSDLQGTHTQLKKYQYHSAPVAIKERLFKEKSKTALANPQNWIIGGLLLILSTISLELHRSKMQIANQDINTPAVDIRATDQAIHLVATEPGAMANAHGQIVIRPDQSSHVLSLQQLPQASESEIYRLWAITPEGIKGCVHFLPDESGAVLMMIPPQPTASATKLLISLDPISSREEHNTNPSRPVLTGSV